MTDDTTNVLRARAHPIRLQILSLLTGTELSATEVARELGITHANASYHLRTLLAAHELVIASEEKVRGGVAKRYRHPWQETAGPPPAGSRRTSIADRQQYLRVVADELIRRAQLSRTGRMHISDAELWVTPEDYARVLELTREASTALHAAARPPRTEGTVRVNLTAALFPMDAGQTRTEQDTAQDEAGR
jgi:DNA-binding transcriptional ArsR family regulator